MILDLRAFEEFPVQTTVRAETDEIKPFDASVLRVDEVVGEVAIQKSAQEYYCQARLSAKLTLECARCLVPYEAEVSARTSFVICSEDVAAEYAGRDSEEYVYYQGNDLRVDIVEPVRQALILTLPMKPLCDENCRGLCQKCGANLNQANCDCEKETTDPRWDGLKNLSQE